MTTILLLATLSGTIFGDKIDKTYSPDFTIPAEDVVIPGPDETSFEFTEDDGVANLKFKFLGAQVADIKLDEAKEVPIDFTVGSMVLKGSIIVS